MMRSSSFIPAIGLLIAATPACSLVGPSCLARQERGTVTALSGEVAAGTISVHQVPYGSQGSQNDVDIRWSEQFDSTGSRIRVYATKVGCSEFVPERPGGPCASIGSAGGYADPATGKFVQTHLIITNGRGNPDVLGSPPEYKLWVVGDSARDVRYTMTIAWFYGPDC